MFATFDYRNPSEWTGLSALLVYPRLFGGLILVATLLRLNTQEAISVQCPQKGALTA
jgi:hypothetical protein